LILILKKREAVWIEAVKDVVKKHLLITAILSILFFGTKIICNAVETGMTSNENDVFDFRYFEQLNLPGDERAAEAQRYLAKKFPPGSNAMDGVNEVELAGASCQQVHDRGEFYWCHYNIHKFFDVEWKVAFNLVPGTNLISTVSVGRAINGL
jgi:hypothetical protein